MSFVHYLAMGMDLAVLLTAPSKTKRSKQHFIGECRVDMHCSSYVCVGSGLIMMGRPGKELNVIPGLAHSLFSYEMELTVTQFGRGEFRGKL